MSGVFVIPGDIPGCGCGGFAPAGAHDAGAFRQLSAALIQALTLQYRTHPGWTVQLHYDNLRVAVAQDPALGPLSSYSTIRRYMKARGYLRKRTPRRDTPGGRQAEARLARLEIRSYEAQYVQGLWHGAFHHGPGRYRRTKAVGSPRYGRPFPSDLSSAVVSQ